MLATTFTIYCEDVRSSTADIPLFRRGWRLDTGLAFGKALRQRRKEAGFTQEQLALEAEIQRNYVSLIERGINQPTITIIFKLAKALGCTPSALVSDVENIVNTEFHHS
ncbi:helix-turn-helix domain-containing protein [Pseudomonas fragi]|uniref:helix-turn-helix domain-containing protein n=1 Tax=Pseudomonas fragi TaxID=296 RepID=UPI0020053168|nr:helix-turn-helix transcriptional regulator [Pseudomonas fragi]MCK6251263.1 helix-turn-helix domain-containing protein [Pseudomonas fragi]